MRFSPGCYMSNQSLALLDWDWADRAGFLGFLAQSADEFVGMVRETQVVISDPDWPDKRVSAHKIVDYAFDVIANYLDENTSVLAMAAAMPANASRGEALGILERFSNWAKVKDAVLWLADHLDEFVQFVLPYILPLILDKRMPRLPFKLPGLRLAA